jgi:hypothetical protein
MSNDKMREEFEAWLIPAWSREKFVDEDGDLQYREDWVQGAWIGWQASRAALVIELPEAFHPDHDWGPCMESGEVRAAIEAAGLKVKP